MFDCAETMYFIKQYLYICIYSAVCLLTILGTFIACIASTARCIVGMLGQTETKNERKEKERDMRDGKKITTKKIWKKM